MASVPFIITMTRMSSLPRLAGPGPSGRFGSLMTRRTTTRDSYSRTKIPLQGVTVNPALTMTPSVFADAR